MLWFHLSLLFKWDIRTWWQVWLCAGGSPLQKMFRLKQVAPQMVSPLPGQTFAFITAVLAKKCEMVAPQCKHIFVTKMLIWDSWEGYELLLMLMLLLRQDDIHIWIIFYLFRSCWTHFDPIFNLIHKSGRGRDEWKLWNSAKDKVFPVFHKPFEQLDMRWLQKLGKVGRRRRRTLTSDRRLVEIMNLESNWNIKLYGYKFLWLKLQKHEINICSPVRSPGLIFTEPLPHQTSLAALAGLA